MIVVFGFLTGYFLKRKEVRAWLVHVRQQSSLWLVPASGPQCSADQASIGDYPGTSPAGSRFNPSQIDSWFDS